MDIVSLIPLILEKPTSIVNTILELSKDDEITLPPNTSVFVKTREHSWKKKKYFLIVCDGNGIFSVSDVQSLPERIDDIYELKKQNKIKESEFEVLKRLIILKPVLKSEIKKDTITEGQQLEELSSRSLGKEMDEMKRQIEILRKHIESLKRNSEFEKEIIKLQSEIELARYEINNNRKSKKESIKHAKTKKTKIKKNTTSKKLKATSKKNKTSIKKNLRNNKRNKM